MVPRRLARGSWIEAFRFLRAWRSRGPTRRSRERNGFPRVARDDDETGNTGVAGASARFGIGRRSPCRRARIRCLRRPEISEMNSMVPFLFFLVTSMGDGQSLFARQASCNHDAGRAGVPAASVTASAGCCASCDACPCKDTGVCDCPSCPCGAARQASKVASSSRDAASTNARKSKTASAGACCPECADGCPPGCCEGGCCKASEAKSAVSAGSGVACCSSASRSRS